LGKKHDRSRMQIRFHTSSIIDMLIKYFLSPFLLCPVMYKSLRRVDSTV
jgi:hypothetical protein